jgi:hypothetical protein
MIGERMWKEAAVAQFKVISWYLPAGTEENHEKPVKIAGLWVEILYPIDPWFETRSRHFSSILMSWEFGTLIQFIY